MKLIKKLILLSIFSILLNSCSGLTDASKVLRNEKKVSKDEFYIKKQEPLTQPPDFEKIPEPGSIKKEQKARVDSNNIERIIKRSQNNSPKNQTKSSSTEESILKKIKK
jgi:hypothetical protein